MPTTAELLETRAARLDAANTILRSAEAAGRDLDAAESSRFDELRSEISALDSRLERARFLADCERRAGAETIANASDRGETRGYSVAKAVAGALAGRIDGLEGETHRELSRGREARSGAGVAISVPTSVLLGAERRDGQTATTGAAGGFLVGTATAAPIDRFRPRLLVESMGASVMAGLVGNVDLPRLKESGSVGWVGENVDATRSAATFESVSLTPLTITGEYRLSRRLMLQASTTIEPLLRSDLGQLLAGALDRAAIAGTGTGQPLGLINWPGIGSVPGPGGITWGLGGTASDLISALEVDDVTGTGAFAMNPLLMGAARKITDGVSLPIPTSTTFFGRRAETSTSIPADLGDDDNLTPLIYGVWSELTVGYWSAVDLLVNPFHPDVASNGGVLLHAFLDADTAIRRPEAFAVSLIDPDANETA